MKRLGVLRADGMGDMVMTFGFLRRLREHLPHTRITLICQGQWSAWMRDCPWVDGVVGVSMSSTTGLRLKSRGIALRRFIKTAWPLDFEMVLNPGTLFAYAPSRTLAWFSGAPFRACWEDPDCGIDTGGSLNTVVFPFGFHLHETEKCRMMLEAIGLESSAVAAGTWWTAADERDGKSIADSARNGRRQLVALGIGASERAKRWPRRRFLDLVRELRKQDDVSFLAMGGADVAADCAWLAEQDSSVTASTSAGIGASWAAVAKCDLYIGNDTGLMHLAAVAKIPVVAIIGIPPGAPPGTRGDTQTGPVGTVARIVRPAFRSSSDFSIDVSSIEPGNVASAALSLLH